MFSSRNTLRTLGASRIAVAAALSVACLTIAGPSAATTVAVQCPGQSINAAIGDAFSGQGQPPINDQLILNVSGTCTENVQTPPLRLITISGKPGTIIQPKSANRPALEIRGAIIIRNVSVRSSLANSGPLIRVHPLTYLEIANSTVKSTTANALLDAFGQAHVEIYNSTFSGGKNAAVRLSGNAHVGIVAGEGGTTTIQDTVEGASEAIGCYEAALTVHADNGSKVFIGPSASEAISARGCTAVIGGHGPGAGLVRILGAEGIGILVKSGGSFSLVQVNVLGNPGKAIEISSGVMEIDSSTIGNNGAGLDARRGAIIRFNDIYGPSTVGGDDPFSCYQEGRIYADPGHIVGKNAPSDDGCLKVGENID